MKVNGVDFDKNILTVSPEKKAASEKAFRDTLAQAKQAREANGVVDNRPTARESRESDWNRYLEKFKDMGLKEAIYDEMVEKLKEEAEEIVLEREGLDEGGLNTLPIRESFLIKAAIKLELKKLIVAANDLAVEQANKEINIDKGKDAEVSMSTTDSSTPSI